MRPTSDRLRETLFNVLSSSIEDAKFVDLCAGTGAVGIEALSRGASHVTFIESSRRAAQVLNDNLKLCGITEGARVINRDVVATLKYFATYHMQFDFFYFDPPYDAGLYGPVMWAIVKGKLVAEAGIVIVEHRRNIELAASYDYLRPYRQITQGDTCLTFFSMDRGNA